MKRLIKQRIFKGFLQFKLNDFKNKMDFYRILDNFNGKKIMIIGDIMLDKYVYGNVLRVSPEAPVPVVKLNEEIYELGGAGNVASNISSLGGKAILFSFIGKDNESRILKKILNEKKIESYLDEDHQTSLKMRIIGNGQQIVRIDKENISEKHFSPEIKKIILEKAKESEIIIISDYLKGAINEDIFKILLPYKKKIIVQPKPANKNLYANCMLVIPNKNEAFEMSGFNDVDSAIEALKKEFNSNILVTLSEEGMLLFTDKKQKYLHLHEKFMM